MKKFLKTLVLLFLLCVVLLALPPVRRQVEQRLYPRKYNDLVEQYAAEYDLDPLLVYSFIRTESGFDPGATSSVDARGLMQMTEETFLWLRSKLGLGEEVSFGDLYDPDVSIRFGCYYLHLCLVRYNGDISTAAAAYHSGWGTVDALLQKEEHSEDANTEIHDEAVSALTMLGFAQAASQKVVAAILKEEPAAPVEKVKNTSRWS